MQIVNLGMNIIKADLGYIILLLKPTLIFGLAK